MQLASLSPVDLFLPDRNVTYVPAKIFTVIGVTADAYRFTAFQFIYFLSFL